MQYKAFIAQNNKNQQISSKSRKPRNLVERLFLAIGRDDKF